MSSGESDPRTFAREHHVHYDLEERVAGAVGRDLRLFAAHEKERLGVPACPRCVELLAELRAFAERVLAREGARPLEVVPEPAALYEASDDRGKDEVALTLRFEEIAGQEAGGGALERAVRELEALGVPRRA